jgi:pathogenesis-related protein 1
LYKKESLGIITVLATAAILTVLSSELQLSYAQTDQNLESKILDVHNSERAAVRVEPLTGSNSLAAAAQPWAQELATTQQVKHDFVNTGGSTGIGENIAGYFNDVSGKDQWGNDQGQSKWVAEKSLYTGGPSFYAVGHYTQMVWANTKQVGCGTAPPSPGGHAFSILVCRYEPGGNFPGELPYPGAAPPSQAVAEEETTNTQSGAQPEQLSSGGAAPPRESGGGSVG